MMSKSFIRFMPPDIDQSDIDAVTKVMKSGWLSTGERAHLFEEVFRNYVGAKYAVAVNSCTAALHLSLLAHGVGQNERVWERGKDEVIVPTMTFAATANVVEHVGAVPKFVDCDDTFNTTWELIQDKITPYTKAVIPVHFGGRPCDMQLIWKIAYDNDIRVIEDCAHAIGSEYDGKKIGSSLNFCCFSFYPTKNMTTIEGGMITSGNKEMMERIRKMSLHGLSKDAYSRFSKKGSPHYDVEMPGFKYNMPDISAALGLSQMKRVDKFNEIREDYAAILYDGLETVDGLILPKPSKYDIKNSWHLFPLLLNPKYAKIKRDKLLEQLKAKGIGCGVHYRALHQHSYYKNRYGLKDRDFPKATFISNNTFSVPFSHSMSEEELDRVIKVLKGLVK